MDASESDGKKRIALEFAAAYPCLDLLNPSRELRQVVPASAPPGARSGSDRAGHPPGRRSLHHVTGIRDRWSTRAHHGPRHDLLLTIESPCRLPFHLEHLKEQSKANQRAHTLKRLSFALPEGAMTDVDSGNQKSSCQITIDWGDGAKVKEVIAMKFLTKNFLISGQHVYQKSGNFQATLTIRDSNGLQLTATQTMVIPSR